MKQSKTSIRKHNREKYHHSVQNNNINLTVSITDCCPLSRTTQFMTQKFWSVQRSLRALTICAESSLKFSVKRYGLICRTEKRNGIELHHLQNTVFHFFTRGSMALLALVIHAKVWKISIVSVKAGKSQYLRRYTFHLKNFQRDETFNLNSHRNFRVFYTNGKRSKSLLITAYGQLSTHAHYRQCSAYAQFGHCLWGTRWRPALHFPTKLQNKTSITIIELGSQNIVICQCLAEQSLPLIRGNERSSRHRQMTISTPPSNSLRRDDLFPAMPFA